MDPPADGGDEHGRLTFQEQMRLVSLPDRTSDGRIVKRYMSIRAAYVPGMDLNFPEIDQGSAKVMPFRHSAAFGGQVYSQAGLAASKTFREISTDKGLKKFGIHTIHGYFSEAGRSDRPFVYEVSVIATNPSFYNLLVTVRQPTTPTSNGSGDNYPLEDSRLPLGPVCFTAMVSFRPTSTSYASTQEPPPQSRFSAILDSRSPSEWDFAPSVDITGIVMALPLNGPGRFPILEMKKADMSVFNDGKPMHEKRELILYRLLAPLPESDPDAHIMAHAFETDRNGLLMVGNNVGWGFDFGRAASLSYTFVVHVNPSEAVMKYGDGEWWIQEACFPRVEAGRGIIMSKLWSPKGVHVATEYQDGIVQPRRKRDTKEKL